MTDREGTAQEAVDGARLRALCESAGFEDALRSMARMLGRTCGVAYDESSKATYALAAVNGVAALLNYDAQQQVATELRLLREAVETHGAGAVLALRGLGVRFDDLHHLTEARQAAIAGMAGNRVPEPDTSPLHSTRQRLMEADRASVDAALHRN